MSVMRVLAGILFLSSTAAMYGQSDINLTALAKNRALSNDSVYVLSEVQLKGCSKCVYEDGTVHESICLSLPSKIQNRVVPIRLVYVRRAIEFAAIAKDFPTILGLCPDPKHAIAGSTFTDGTVHAVVVYRGKQLVIKRGADVKRLVQTFIQ